MIKTLLDVIRQVSGELAQPVPSAVLSSQESSVNQMKALTIAACDELLDMHDWQRSVRTHAITTTEGVSEYPLPADYHRSVSNTQWDRTNTRRFVGGLTPPAWAALNITTPGEHPRFRIVGNKIVVFPVPSSSATTITFDYITRFYVYDVGLQGLKADFTEDSDLTIFHDRLLMNFVKLKFLQEQGLDTMAAAENFNQSLAAAKSNDTPAPYVRLVGCAGMHFLDGSNLPASDWGA